MTNGAGEAKPDQSASVSNEECHSNTMADEGELIWQSRSQPVVTYLQAGLMIDEIIEGQRRKVLSTAKRILPHITEEDLLQPNDFPELEFHPHFRYEEGILDGLRVARMALMAGEKERGR